AAVAEPAAVRPDVDILRHGELPARAADEVAISRHPGGDGTRIGEPPALTRDLGLDSGVGRQHRHRKALPAALRHLEEAEEIDVLRPDVAGAAELDVLALVLPCRDRAKAFRPPSIDRPELRNDGRPRRAPRDAA